MTRRVRKLLSESPLAFAMPRTESAPASIAIGRKLSFKNIRATPATDLPATKKASEPETAVNEDADGEAARTRLEMIGGESKEEKVQEQQEQEQQQQEQKQNQQQQLEEVESKVIANHLPPSTPKHDQEDSLREMYQSTQDLARVFAAESMDSAVKRISPITVVKVEENELRRSESGF